MLPKAFTKMCVSAEWLGRSLQQMMCNGLRWDHAGRDARMDDEYNWGGHYGEEMLQGREVVSDSVHATTQGGPKRTLHRPVESWTERWLVVRCVRQVLCVTRCVCP